MLHYKKPVFWLIAAAVVSCVVLAVVFLTDPPELEINDIFESEDYTILWQTRHYMALEIPKDALPDSIYTAEGHTFEENEVIAYQTDTSTVYLERVKLAGDEGDQLCFEFNISHALPESGVVLTQYLMTEDGVYRDGSNLQSTSLWDDASEFEDALGIQGFGPGEHFSFYVSTNACKAATGTLKIKAYCVETVYEKTFKGEKKQLTREDLIRLSKKGKTLSWEDFRPYLYNEPGMGLYIRSYEIDEMFRFAIAGTPGAQVIYMHLFANDDTEAYIDVRVDDVGGFIEEHKDNPVVKNCSASWSTNPVGFSEETMTKMLELGGHPKDLARSSVQTIPVVQIESLEELDEFIRQMDGLMDFEKTYPDCTSFLEDADRYYESGYFDRNTLFLLYLTEPTTADRLGMERICTVGSTLMLDVSLEVHQDAETGTVGWLIPVSIANADLTEVTEVQASVRSISYPDREIEAMYQFEESADISKPTVFLMNDGTFQFSFSSYSSYYGMGTFELENDKLTLRTDDGKYTYVFDMTEDAIVFDADASSEMLWYSDLYDGAVLPLQ